MTLEEIYQLINKLRKIKPGSPKIQELMYEAYLLKLKEKEKCSK